MVNGIMGKKLGMTQVFDETGRVVPVTVVEAGPCVVTQVKTADSDGYEAVQIGFGEIKESHVTKPAKGHLAKSRGHVKRHLREVSVDTMEGVELGQELKADLFAAGDVVKVTGISKGKGFAGAVKRWHFHGGDMTHGSMVHRKPQSGGATDAARTFKGVRRPGRMGGKRITQRGLTIFRVDSGRNVILIKGAVPGAIGALVMISRQEFGG